MDNEEVRLLSLKAENVKRIEAVEIVFNQTGLTTIGGANGAGKTSVLDVIIWALGGDKYKPSNFMHDGADKVNICLDLGNGVTVTRTGKNGALKVSGGDGKQSLLDTFYGALTMDLPKFMAATETEKTKKLLEAFPELGAKLQSLNEMIAERFDQRTIVGRDQLQKQKYADELKYHEGIPDEPMVGTEMVKRLTAAMGVNAANDEIRRNATTFKDDIARKELAAIRQQARVAEVQGMLDDAIRSHVELTKAVATAKAAYDEAVTKTEGLVDKDTTAIQAELEDIDLVNAKVRDNQNKLHAQEAAKILGENYASISDEIEELRQRRLDLLKKSKMPMDGLSIDEDSKLVFNGNRWDCMSTSEQYRVATALSAALKPSCKFVLLDRLESMDRKELAAFDVWLKEQGLQGIATRVSEGDECHIIIEDGSNAPVVTAKKYDL